MDLESGWLRGTEFLRTLDNSYFPAAAATQTFCMATTIHSKSEQIGGDLLLSIPDIVASISSGASVIFFD